MLPLKSMPPLRPMLSPMSMLSLMSILSPMSILLIPAGVLLVVRPVINETACSWACGSNNQPLLNELEFLKGIDLDKVQTFKIILQDEMKGQCSKWLKSSCEMFINILFEDINNDPSLIPIGEINFNCIQERRYFNALVNPISTNKEPEDEHEDEIKELNQEVDYLKDIQEVNINLILWVRALQFLSFPLTIYNTF